MNRFQRRLRGCLLYTSLRAAPWFALHYAISVLPSVSSLKALRLFAANSHAPEPFIGIGDPLLKNHPPAGQENRGAVALADVYKRQPMK